VDGTLAEVWGGQKSLSGEEGGGHRSIAAIAGQRQQSYRWLSEAEAIQPDAISGQPIPRAL